MLKIIQTRINICQLKLFET